MSRFLWCVFLMFLYTSCELEYNDNQRLLFKGTLDNIADKNYPDLPVEAYASGNFLSFALILPIAQYKDIDLIGSSVLDDKGSFFITTISPANEDSLFIIVNDPNNSVFNPAYPTLLIQGIAALPFENFTYAIPEVTSDEIINTQLNIKRIDNLTDTLSLEIKYNSTLKLVDFNSDSDTFQLQKTIELIPDQIEGLIIFENIKNEPLHIEYQLRNDGIIKQREIALPFTSETNSYEFEF